MNRRDFIGSAAVAGFLGISGLMNKDLLAKEMAKAVNGKQPNIILIMSDDMGFSDIGCYGGEISTPNLDKLADNGIRFTQFYNTARCCPTRASLLTGLHPHQTGIGHMEGDWKLESYRGRLNNKCMTIAEVLKHNGYATFMAGKWHVAGLGYEDKSNHNWPRQRGFDKFYGTIRGAGSFYDPETLTRDNTPISALNDSQYKPTKYYYTDAITDNMNTYIDEHMENDSGKPFFSYVAYTAAHWPMHAFEEDVQKYKGKYDKGYDAIRRKRFDRLKKMKIINSDCKYTETVGDWDNCDFKDWEARCMEVYAAMVERMDRGIGQIVENLKKHGQLDNTIIFFLQDNGGCAEGLGRGIHKDWYLGGVKPMKDEDLQDRFVPPMRTRDGRPVLGGKTTIPGPDGTYIAYGKNWANVSNTPFKQYKHWVHEGGISTPLIVHWPNGIDKKHNGKLRQQTGQLTDIMKSCVVAANAKYPAEYNGNNIHPMEGVSLLPALNSDDPVNREALYWEHEGNRAIRIGDWKLVSKAHDHDRKYDSVEVLPLSEWELFNIKKDRSEKNNLASEYPDKVKKMSIQWQDWSTRIKVYPKSI